jgi:membrane protein
MRPVPSRKTLKRKNRNQTTSHGMRLDDCKLRSRDPVVTTRVSSEKNVARRTVKRLWDVARASGERFSDCDGPRLAASMSYYAVFSLFPLLLVLGALAEHALGDSQALRDRLLNWAAGTGSSGMKQALEQALEDVAARAPSATVGVVLGIVGALLGASGVFIDLDAALERIFRVRPRRLGFFQSLKELVLERLMGFVVVIATSLVLLVTTIARGAIELPSSVPGASIVGSAASLVIGGGALTTGIALCYRLLPKSRVSWSSAWKGALVASLSLHVVREPFAWFVVHLTSYAAYGVMGAVLGLLGWFQVAACLLLYGACIAAESASSSLGNTGGSSSKVGY